MTPGGPGPAAAPGSTQVPGGEAAPSIILVVQQTVLPLVALLAVSPVVTG